MKKTRRRILAGLLALCMVFSLLPIRVFAAGKTWYVTQQGAGTKDGSSWANASQDLKGIMDGASEGDQIWVARGTYRPGTKPTDTFLLKKGVKVYGGFAGNEDDLADRNWTENETTLTGQIDETTQAYHVVTGGAGAEPEDTCLDGFTVTGGNANGPNNADQRGGGMYNLASSPAVVNSTFSANKADGAGGGMYNEGTADKPTSPRVSKCIFSGNETVRLETSGGGMCNLYSNSTVENCTFVNNKAVLKGGGIDNLYSSPMVVKCNFLGNVGDEGGGMANKESSPTLVGCTFTGNVAGIGGGIYNKRSSKPTLVNCTLSGNTADGGGGMWNEYDASPTLLNCTLSANTAKYGGGMLSYADSSPTLANTILWANSATDDGTGSDIHQDGATLTLKNCVVDLDKTCQFENNPTVDQEVVLKTDPKLIPLDAEGKAIEDPAKAVLYGLGNGSSALNAGLGLGNKVNGREVPNQDQRGTTRPQGAGVDIGAFEAVLYTLTYDSNGGGDETMPEDTAIAEVAFEVPDPTFTPPPGKVFDTWAIGRVDSADKVGGGESHVFTETTTLYAQWRTSKTWYVTETGAGSEDGSSWANASPNLAKVMNKRAQAGDQIWVAKGTYKPGTKPTDTFNLKKGVKVYGGFAGNEAGLADRNWTENETILTGQIDETIKAYHVVTGGAGAEPEDTRLDGFTVTGGRANGLNDEDQRGGGMYNASSSPKVTACTFTGNEALLSGGGMHNDNSSPAVTACTFTGNMTTYGGGMSNSGSGSPTVTGCTFTGNVAYYSGGGMSNQNASPTLTGCTFTDNQVGERGGGVYNENAGPTLMGCTFTGNEAGNYGGGMSNLNASPILTGCAFTGNWADYYGGGISNQASSSPTLTNCTITGNEAGDYGGGIYNDRSSPKVVNCTITGNGAEINGGGMYNESASIPTLVNTILWNNSAGRGSDLYQNGETLTPDHCIIGPSYVYNNGLVNPTNPVAGDPLLVKLDREGKPTNDLAQVAMYGLGEGSPALDAGLGVGPHTLGGVGVEIPNTDQRGTSRPQGPGVDIGAYECAPLYNVNDIAAINAIINAHAGKTGMTPADPVNSTGVPDDWGADGKVVWSDALTDRRVIELKLTYKGLDGILDVSGLTALRKLNCIHNQLTGIQLNGQAAYTDIDARYNHMAGQDEVRGQAVDWTNPHFKFTPQRLVSFTAQEVGGASGTTNSSKIEITFDQSVEGLTQEKIRLEDGTDKVRIKEGSLTGSGTTWTLEIEEVLAEGEISLTIDDFSPLANETPFKVTNNPRTVTVYKAQPAPTYVLHIKDKDYTAEDLAADINKTADEGWSWQAETNTLTLDNYEGDYIRYSEEGEAERDITILAKDGTNNTITVPNGVAQNGIYADGNITLSGDGNVSVCLLNEDDHDNSAGIYSKNGHVTVDMAGNLDITAAKQAGIVASKNVTLSGDGKISITAFDGINNGGNIILSSAGDVIITTSRTGIEPAYSITYSGSGDLSIEAGDNGIYAGKDVILSGSGNLSILANHAGIYTFEGDVIHSGSGMLTVKSGGRAVYLRASGKELKLNGTGTPLIFTAGENKKAIYNLEDDSSPVGGDNFANYKATGAPNQNYVRYDRIPPSYSVIVQYDPDMGTAVAEPAKANADSPVTLTATAHAGHVFKKWEVVSGGATLDDPNAAKTGFKMPAEDVTVKAHFEKAPAPTFKVTYAGNGNDGGQAPTDPIAYTEGAQVTVMGPGILTKTGHTFSRWNTAADGSGTDREVGETFPMPAGGVTLYAQWEETPPAQYQVTVNKGSGTGRYPVGETVTIKANDPESGMRFKAWEVNSENVTLDDANQVQTAFKMPADDVVVTATYDPIPVTGVTLDQTELNLTVGQTHQLNARVSPTDAANQEVDWISDNPDVAKVSSEGLVTAVGAGNATITVITADGQKTDTCQVRVEAQGPAVAVTRVRLDKSFIRLAAGTSQKLNATVSPDNATNKTVVWKSSNESVAQVDQNGLVTAISQGMATITATSDDGGKTARCRVRVTKGSQPVAVTGVMLDQEAMTLVLGESKALTATIIPTNAANQGVTWDSSDSAIATVDGQGLVRAVSPGQAIITVTTDDGHKTATCTVTVLDPEDVVSVEGVTLNKEALTLAVGRTETLEATVTPEDASNQEVIWESTDPSVATVDEKGLVTAKAVGTVTIRVTTKDGSKTAECTVTVTRRTWFIGFPFFPFF